ncbi:MAG: hypothetical protein K940chlam3_00730 [Chlamydiae bacterium]|nr:hypothetical protein [Chlamydiota bacterium]
MHITYYDGSSFTFGSSVNISGGRTIMRSGGMTLDCCGSDLSLTPVSSNRKLAWKLYLEHISPTEVETISDGAKAIRTIEKSISKIDTSYESIPDDLEDIESEPVRYLTTAILLHKKIKKLFFEITGRKDKLLISGGQFNRHLDKAERHTLKVFENIFDHHVMKGDLDAALKAISSISKSYQASLCYYKLANLYFKEGRHDEMFSVLNKIEFTTELDDQLKKFTKMLALSVEDREVCSGIKRMKNEDVAKIMISEMVNHALESDDILRAKNIVARAGNKSTGEKAWINLVKKLISRKEYDMALEVIPNIPDDYEKEKQYKAIIKILIKKEKISEALTVISRMGDSYERDKQYKEIIKHYSTNGNISSALKIISKMNDSYEQDKEYKKIVNYYKGKGNVEAALKIVRRMDCSYEQDKIYLTLIKDRVRIGDKTTALKIVGMMDCEYEQGKAYKMIATGRV